MTTDVLKLPGDYKVITKSGGTLTLDVGGTSTNGTVVIDGNLNVLGIQTAIESINATIKDNILILNSGESNSSPTGQVTLGTSGIMVARGFSDASTAGAFLLYDDSFSASGFGFNLTGIWKFGNNNRYGRAIEVSAVTIPSGINTLTFFSSVNPNAVLSVKGTSNYASHVTDPDHIPNKQYVDDKLFSTELAQRLQVGGTFIELNDNSVSTGSEYYNVVDQITMALGTSTNIALKLQGTVAQFHGLTINNSAISANGGTATNISITPSGNGIVQMGSAVQIKQTPAIASTASYTGIYSTSTVGGGGTGLYFVNTDNTDELVSRKKSIIYGIIF
jgi:hypothetical protein